MVFLLLTLNVQYATSLAYWNALLPVFLKDCMTNRDDWDDKQKNTVVFQCMSMLAFGSVVGSLLLGHVMDKRGPIACVYVVIATTVVVQSS